MRVSSRAELLLVCKVVSRFGVVNFLCVFDVKMTQLRSFVYQRMYKAAEKILEEVDKLALLKANAQRLKKEPEGSSEPHLTTSALKREEELQGISSQPATAEESNLIKAEFQTDLGIKDELEEHGQEVINPSIETEQDQPENEASGAIPPMSSDDSEAESEIEGSDEETVQDKGAQKKPDGKSSARSQADLRVCPMCGKGFLYIPLMVKHMKKHKKIDDPTKKLIDELQSFYIRKICNVCGKKFANTWGLILHSKKCRD